MRFRSMDTGHNDHVGSTGRYTHNYGERGIHKKDKIGCVAHTIEIANQQED